MTGIAPDQGHSERFGRHILALADWLAGLSESQDGLTCTYLTDAHRKAAALLRDWMRDAGMETEIDAAGNVVGRYAGATADARTLILGSHYDTVRNAGKYDGRLGILTAIAAVDDLNRARRRLPFAIEVIGFSEEEGVRFSSAYLGSSAVAGRFDPRLLQARDESGETLDSVMRAAGLDPGKIPRLARDPAGLLGYVELHIEQGPVLLNEGLPLGIVTSIAGAARYAISITGVAGHAGTVPMALRHDAAAAAAEIVLFVERRCAATPDLVGTVGRLAVPDGAVNVVPGRCELSLDMRSAGEATLQAAVADVMAEIARTASRRGVSIDTRETLRTPSVPCSPRLQAELAAAVARSGAPVRHLVSGAGHDAVMFHGVTEIGMLFVRCGNGGISHSPRETVSVADADIAARVLRDFLLHFGTRHDPR
jgi:allantoate deiminase/N-carbamoyl-L-amino-acid hydrolase